MDISKIREIIKELKIYEQIKEKEVQQKPSSSDKVEISSEAKEKLKYTNGERISYIKTLITNLPEIREDKIKEIRARIKEGYYNSEEVKREAIENLLRFFNL